MGKATEILEKTIKELEEKNSELEETIQMHERCINWMVHRVVNEKKKSKEFVGYDKLPLPRIEMQINPLRENWYEVEWLYGIVYKHYDDTLLFVPIGRTTGNGDYRAKFKKPLHTISSTDKLPFRDGLHFRTEMKLFGLRGFLLFDGQIEEILDCEKVYSKETFEKAMKNMKR